MDGSRADGLLERPVVETVAALVDRCLSQAGRAVRKVGRPGNPEALHDFRVALRRCRGVLRAYRPWLGKAAGKRVRSELRRLMRQTNRGRDAEVQIVWLEAARPSLRRSERAGLNYLLERLRRPPACRPRRRRRCRGAQPLRAAGRGAARAAGAGGTGPADVRPGIRGAAAAVRGRRRRPPCGDRGGRRRRPSFTTPGWR